MISATVFEAKTKLSELLKHAANGEEVVITTGREKKPVARIEAIAPVGKKRLGVLQTRGFVLTESFFEPLPAEELTAWNEGSE